MDIAFLLNCESTPDVPDATVAGQSEKKKWSETEDEELGKLRQAGMKWEDISQKLPGRSAASCISRERRLKEPRKDAGGDGKTNGSKPHALVLAPDTAPDWRCIYPCESVVDVIMIRHAFGSSIDFLPFDIWPSLCSKHFEKLREEQKNWVSFQLKLVKDFIGRVDQWNKERKEGLVFERWSISQTNSADANRHVLWISEDMLLKKHTTIEILTIVSRLHEEAKKYPKFPAVKFSPVLIRSRRRIAQPTC